tara:strand:+ start:703 stop:1512 length:810 start_codon:yes stop_codon:yes gene_type:complete
MSIRNAEVQTGACHIGAPDFSKLGIPNVLPTGILTCPGISIFGGSLPTAVPRAAVSIGPPLALAAPFSLEVIGISNFIGNTNQLGIYTCTGVSFFNGVHTVNALDITNGAKMINGSLNVNGPTICAGNFFALYAFWAGSIVGTSKLFDIPHPTKEGHRLAHGSLEGPELGVYHRGKLKNSNEIKLPDYWKGLVDENTITVQLQPIGDRHFHLNVVEYNIDRVIIKEADDKPIECFYIIFAERKDVDKLIVEYEAGPEPEDIMPQGGARK